MQRHVILSGSQRKPSNRLGQTVRPARLRRNLSQAGLADRTDSARASIAAPEDGRSGLGIGVLLKA